MQLIAFFLDFNELAKYLNISTDKLWELGVCGDDYDYFLLADNDFGLMDRLLSGCCTNDERIIEVNGKRYLIGGAYHS